MKKLNYGAENRKASALQTVDGLIKLIDRSYQQAARRGYPVSVNLELALNQAKRLRRLIESGQAENCRWESILKALTS